MSYNQSIKNRNKTQVELIANSAIKSLAGAIENDEKKFKEKGALISFDVNFRGICGPEMRQETALQRFCPL